MKTTDNPNDGGITRRDLVTALSAGTMAITVGGLVTQISSADDGQESTAIRHLNASEWKILESLGDTLVPGAAKAGIARYVDDQLGRSVPLLFLKYMDYPGSFVEFYKQGLHALDGQSESRYGRLFADLEAEQRSALIRDLSKKTPPGWSGPPAPLFYFVTRNDAADVYYGTPQGFEKLGIPYMAPNKPPANW